MTKKEIRKKREDIFRKSPTKTLIKKGDKRISSPSRVCGICGESLSKMIYHTGKVISSRNHYHIKYSDFLYIDICQDINSCYRNLKKG